MSFAAAVDDRWFEDYVPGAVHEFGAMTVEEDEVLAFGRRFDPQVFHTDPERQSGRSTAD
jgi:acyl dehydratase